MPYRSPTQVLRDRAEVAARYLRGEKQWQIAAALGFSQQTVSKELLAVHEEWRQSAMRDFDAHKAQELAKLDALEVELWAAWERSKQPLEHVHTEKVEDEIAVRAGHAGRLRLPAKRTRIKASKRTEQQNGNSAFLFGIERVVEQRAKILGLHSPTDINVTGHISFGDLFALASQDDDKPDIRVLPPVDGEAG